MNFCKFITINEKLISNDVVLKHLKLKLQHQSSTSEDPLSKYLSITSIRESIAAFERNYITHYLEQYDWRVSATAQAIGIERTTLYKKMKQLGINAYYVEE
ncbi:MAG TPA: helix-turn-helix domain-containing protein [Candidatus Cloacimonadota bacterium]|nr:helix-turn-helix domain-containing protein [Candidatus Cloacimonadota bacterium]